MAQFASRYFRLPQRRFKNLLHNPFDSKSLANLAFHAGVTIGNSGAPNDNFRKNTCSEDDLRSRIFETFVVKFLACLSLLGFSNI